MVIYPCWVKRCSKSGPQSSVVTVLHHCMAYRTISTRQLRIWKSNLLFWISRCMKIHFIYECNIIPDIFPLFTCYQWCANFDIVFLHNDDTKVSFTLSLWYNNNIINNEAIESCNQRQDNKCIWFDFIGSHFSIITGSGFSLYLFCIPIHFLHYTRWPCGERNCIYTKRCDVITPLKSRWGFGVDY